MPGLLYLIRNRKFSIADLSTNNSGVYFEAGYAEEFGKEVIVCCFKEDAEPAIHFDLKQKNTIFYTKNDLLFKLIKRIEVTIGLKAQMTYEFFDEEEDSSQS